MRRGIFLALCSLVVLAPPGAAQGEPLAVGSEARLYVRGLIAPLEGTLLSLDTAQIRIRTVEGDLGVAPELVTRSEVRGSRGNALRGGLIGLGAGVATGVALVIASRTTCDPTPVTPCGVPDDRSEEWLLVAPALAGAGAGALIGSLFRSGRWVPAFIPAIPPSSGRGVGLSWRLPSG
ncbi:MAG TPA: hypothetical protein VMM35_08640 [Longimicrobiales bacterium]|nr:hypothetical protein [Longimicrobiales bacterium]